MEEALCYSVPFVFASYAFMLTEAELKRRRSHGDEATHEWTCMIRARNPTNTDLSAFVRKVVFHLHPSFPNPQRVVEGAPFEITETGWGEFELSARIYFLDSEEKALEVRHYLKLYPETVTDIRTIVPPKSFRETCVASETADEFIFRSPSMKMRSLLVASQRPTPPHTLSSFYLQTSNTDEETYIAMARLVQSYTVQMQEKVKAEILKKSQDIQALMEIYFTLQPNKALNILVSNPQILHLLNPSAPLNEAKLEEIRTSLKAVQQSRSTGREKPRELVRIFNELINEQVIKWNGCLRDIDFT